MNKRLCGLSALVLVLAGALALANSLPLQVSEYFYGSTYTPPRVRDGTNITSGLVGFWKFDDGSGTTAADSSLNANTGTLINGPGWVSGWLNTAIHCDNTAQSYVDVPTSAALRPLSITIACWINADSFAANSYNVVCRDGDASQYCALYVRSTGKLAVYLTGSSGLAFMDNSGSHVIQTGFWHHIALTYDHNGLSVYVDGQLDATAAANGNLVINASDLTIGTQPDILSRTFQGAIDDFRVYNRVLSGAEIDDLARM